MFRFTTTFALAILCLTKPSCSRPLSKPEKGKPFEINPQILPRLDIVGNVGCSGNAAVVDVNSIHLPLIPCPNFNKSFQERSVKLPLSGRSLKIKRVVPSLLSRSISEQSFIPLPASVADAVATISSNTTSSMPAIDSSIPSWSAATMFTSTSTSSDFIGHVTAIDSSIPKSSSASTSTLTDTSIEARKLHTHHRTLATMPPPTIIIEPHPRLTNLPKLTHTHHRLSKTSKVIRYASVHTHPLPVQTGAERWQTKTTFMWISPPQTRFSIPPPAPISVRKTSLETRTSASASWKRASLHPPAETLYPPVIERGLPSNGRYNDE
ncbi:c764659a-186a-4b8e-a44f-29cf892a527c [Sclerotinia trifoliorum]|uniref:C764659a-186a-4b8e-a44f-29cf892a527c n=1 Tax=Sclerotinia trifoliorum TaxID=28548 RepID=A0A8H2ZSG4_9HELO|nr:c764659a-186a-4b8e-a44f-29cf892a527c [Sclerotinia trifoliorum]